MSPRRILRGAGWLAVITAIAIAGWAGWAAVTWTRFGRIDTPRAEEADSLLDTFMPHYEIVERHQIEVAAPADITFKAAGEMDLLGVPVVRAIIKGRELLLGADPDSEERPTGLLAFTQSIGWVVLSEVPGRQVVVGAVTRPWEANVRFRSIPAAQFAGFDEPGYVKIIWTLRAIPTSSGHSVFRTETRAVATDATSRARFRQYWSWLSPGIVLIRKTMLGPVKAEAERRAGARRTA